MSLTFLHPDDAALTRAADDELTAREAERVTAHVAACARCARAVSGARAVALRVREEPLTVPPSGLVERALARRAAGERVLLPVGDVSTSVLGAPSLRPAARRWRAVKTLLAVAAGVSAVVVTWQAAMSPSEATAMTVTDRLRVVSSRAVPGTRVSVRYAALPALAGAESLVVRAWLLGGAADEPSRLAGALTTLVRAADGSYGGTFTWPSGASVISAAVESFDGATVDANDGELIDLLATDDVGRPTFDALVHGIMRGRRAFYPPRGARTLGSIQRRLSALERRFGDRPETWALMAEFAGPATLWGTWFGDFAQRTRALQRFDAALAARFDTLSPRTRRAMVALAKAQEELQVAAEWEARLDAELRVVDRPARWRWVDRVLEARDSVAARAFLRDSLRTLADLWAAVALAGHRRGDWPPRPVPILPCAELTAAVERVIPTVAPGTRPVGLAVPNFEAWSTQQLQTVRFNSATCTLPDAEYRRQYREHYRGLGGSPLSREEERALWRAPRD